MTIYTNYPNEYSGTEQGIYLGGLQTLASQADATPMNPVGIVTRQQNKLYRYVYFVTTIAGTAAASVAGGAVFWAPTYDPALGIFTVTSDYDTSGMDFAGLALAAGITTARYIWIQVSGKHDAIVVSSGATGNRLIATADSAMARIANSGSNYETNVVHGVVLVGSSTSTGILLGSAGR
jgi:hypothetical protein